MLKSQRKALEDAEKANQISLEEFLEVEVTFTRCVCKEQFYMTGIFLPSGINLDQT